MLTQIVLKFPNIWILNRKAKYQKPTGTKSNFKKCFLRFKSSNKRSTLKPKKAQQRRITSTNFQCRKYCFIPADIQQGPGGNDQINYQYNQRDEYSGFNLAALTTKAVKIRTTCELQSSRSPQGVNTIDQRSDQRPAGRCIDPAQSNQSIRFTENRDILKDDSIGSDGMDSSHSVSVTDIAVKMRNVFGRVNIDKSNSLGKISLAKKTNLPQTERTTAIK